MFKTKYSEGGSILKSFFRLVSSMSVKITHDRKNQFPLLTVVVETRNEPSMITKLWTTPKEGAEMTGPPGLKNTWQGVILKFSKSSVVLSPQKKNLTHTALSRNCGWI